MTAQELYEILKPAQEAKGFYFNQDREHTLSLLEALLKNRQRYGYMACPCRLACGDKDWDRDIICPCVYRQADIEEYGSCYCGLYVSKERNQGKIPEQYVPERRPAEKVLGRL